MNAEYLNKLARLAVRSGANVQPGQLVVLNATVDSVPLARAIVREAYEAGAREVIVQYADDVISRMTYLNADEEIFSQAPAWKVRLLEDSAKEGACYIHILDSDPDGLCGVDPKRISSRSLIMNQSTPNYREGTMNGSNAWTIVASASLAWAKKVFPDLPEEEAIEALWNDIFKVSRIDENDPVENWKKHNDSFEHRLNTLNSYQFEKFHYENSLGTDLWVEMPEEYIFMGGGQEDANGRLTFPNIPTEEVFSAPRKDGVNGVLYSTLPLNLNGSLVRDIVFTFKDGKIVDFDASEGKDLLEEQITMDEGASYLGEIALVPYGSPIQQLDRIFYNTLIDENASCHFAFGRSYPECIPGGQSMSKEERLAHGLNESNNHVDFMVGSEDLKITGYTKDGKEVPVFENGRFVSEFDPEA